MKLWSTRNFGKYVKVKMRCGRLRVSNIACTNDCQNLPSVAASIVVQSVKSISFAKDRDGMDFVGTAQLFSSWTTEHHDECLEIVHSKCIVVHFTVENT